jgi:AraC-like DNA-binding protein
VIYFYEGMRPDFSYKPFLIVSIPSVYLYFKNLISNSKKHNVKDLLHFVFPFIFGCFSLTNFNKQIFSSISVYFVFVVFFIFYLLSSIYLLKDIIWNSKKQHSIIIFQNDKIKKWIQFLFVIYVLIAVRLLLITFFELFQVNFSYGENYSWISGCLFIIILIKIWTSPDILFGYKVLYTKVKDENFSKFALNDIWILTPTSELNNIQDNELKEKVYVSLNKQINRIEKLALKEKWYRSNKTSKAELAEKLNIPKSHINFIFKYHSKISYADFVKRVRTYDAIALIESGYLLTHKLDALALKVGYLSYNPFFSTFKEITGTCPMEYNKEKINLKS